MKTYRSTNIIVLALHKNWTGELIRPISEGKIIKIDTQRSIVQFVLVGNGHQSVSLQEPQDKSRGVDAKKGDQ